MSGRVLVVGSINVDVSLTCARLPSAGETVLADSVHRSGGGKGANQAVGAARAGGAATTLIGAVGDDADGTTMLDRPVGGGGRLRRVARSSSLPTGLALITVDHAAENTIVVAAGANAAVEVTDADRDAVEAADVILAQLEIPQATVVAAARGRRPGVPLILNAAPSAPLSAELVAEVDLLVVNEHEARDLTGADDVEAATAQLLRQVPAVLVTLGAAVRGCSGVARRRSSCRRRRWRRSTRWPPETPSVGCSLRPWPGVRATWPPCGLPRRPPRWRCSGVGRRVRPDRRRGARPGRGHLRICDSPGCDPWMTTSTRWSPDRSTDRRRSPWSRAPT